MPERVPLRLNLKRLGKRSAFIVHGDGSKIVDRLPNICNLGG